jgi:hypothetical protein
MIRYQSKHFMTDIEKAACFAKGEAWQEKVKNDIYPASEYILLHESPKYVPGSRRNESALNPDLKFRNKKDNTVFWVECKYRSALYDGKVNWCSYGQFKRLKSEYKEPVYIAFNLACKELGGIYIVPLTDIMYTSLFPSFFRKYEYKSGLAA